MKTIESIVGILPILLLLIQCSKEDPKAKIASDGQIFVLKNNEEWTSVKASAILNPLNYSSLYIEATGMDNSKIVFFDASGFGIRPATYILDPLFPGQTSFPSFSLTFTDPSHISYPSFYSSQSGQVKLVEIDEVKRTVSGTFFFKAKSNTTGSAELSFSQGSFTKVPISAENLEQYAIGRVDYDPFYATKIDLIKTSQKTSLVFYNAVGTTMKIDIARALPIDTYYITNENINYSKENFLAGGGNCQILSLGIKNGKEKISGYFECNLQSSSGNYRYINFIFTVSL